MLLYPIDKLDGCLTALKGCQEESPNTPPSLGLSNTL